MHGFVLLMELRTIEVFDSLVAEAMNTLYPAFILQVPSLRLKGGKVLSV